MNANRLKGERCKGCQLSAMCLADPQIERNLVYCLYCRKVLLVMGTPVFYGPSCQHTFEDIARIGQWCLDKLTSLGMQTGVSFRTAPCCGTHPWRVTMTRTL